MKIQFYLALSLLLATGVYGQRTARQAPQPRPVGEIPEFSNMQYRLIGPFRGGRASGVSGSYQSENTFYFASTGGGVWKTTDGGSNWKNVSDGFFGGSMGAVEVAPSNENIVYAGEGEATMRGNVSEGLGGVWRSDNAGKTWKNLGLKDGRHITNFVIHPTNPDIVWVGVMGHLFGPNETRGVYKTSDGGKNWKRVLYINNQTGCADLVMEPNNTDVLYAGTWRVQRLPYSLESGGEGSGLYKSTDGGETWTNISSKKGLPAGIWGKVGVAVSRSNTNKVYAIIENAKGGLYVSDDAGDSWTLRSSDNNLRQRAWYYTKVFVDPDDENFVYAPNVAFNYSRDGGRTWQRKSTPHSDHHDIWIDPRNASRLAIADDGGAQVSFDLGDNWSTMMNQPTAEVYRVSTSNAFPYHVMGGQQDNSAFRIRSRTYGAAITNNDLEDAAGSESGYVVSDPNDPDITYGGNYHGMLMRKDHRTNEIRLINVWPIDNMGAGADVAKYRFQWNYPIFFSPHNAKRLYAAGNHLFVSENEGRSWEQISPDLTTNDKSKQGPSGGPVTHDNTTVEYYCTIFTATESETEKDLLWAGSDDGLIHVSRDGGRNWENVTPKGIPQWIMWNCVDVDPHKKGTAYFAGTRYKLDDFTPYLYKTEDYGKTWSRIDNGIDRMHFTRALRADKKVPDLLYAGTEYGMYISHDGGKNWNSFQLNLPVTSITDMTIKNNDLVVGTQGRSIWIFDDLTPVQQYKQGGFDRDLHLFEPAPAIRMQATGRRRGRMGSMGSIPNAGQNPPAGVVVPFWLKNVNDSTRATMTILDKDNKVIRKFETSKEADNFSIRPGYNQFAWDLYYPEGERVPETTILWNRSQMIPMAPPGNYFARLKVGNDSATVPIKILGDPNYKVNETEYMQQFEFLRTAQAKFDQVIKAQREMEEIRRQMNAFTTRGGQNVPASIKELVKDIDKKMKVIEEALHQTKAKSGQDVLNYPIRLDDKLSSVYRVAATGNGAPTKQVQEAYAEVASQIDIELNKWETIKRDEVNRLNGLIRESSIPVIGVKASE